MQKFVMTTGAKVKFLISERERNAVFEAVSQGEKKVIIQGEMVSLQIIPDVIRFERWVVNETQRLASFGQRLCKLCFNPMKDVCSCWPNQGGKKQQAFFLPKGMEEEIMRLAQNFQWPDIQPADSQLAITGPNSPIVGNKEIDFVIDPETGEKIYS